MSFAFLLTSLVIVATPGTGALLTISAGLSRGRRASLITATGCTLGIVPHLVAAVSGTAALLRASGEAFEAVRWAGVAYLLVMAVQTWRDRSPIVASDVQGTSWQRTIATAVLANLLNPKLTIFFFTFLPIFVPADQPHATAQLLLLSGVFMAMTFVVFATYGLVAAALRKHVLGRERVVRRLRQAFAISFVGLGSKLAMTTR